jgi:putative phage-type endonuclease
MIVQGTAEWHAKRLGKVTASRVSDVIAKTRNGWGAGRANYMAELVCERLTGCPTQGFVNGAMQHGIDTEPFARLAYAERFGVDVYETGFIDHPEIAMSGASPDGLVGGAGLLEIKCPQSATHIETLRSGSIADKYVVQMQWQMACAGREWCDFVSFDPRLPESMRLFVQRVPRDLSRITDLEHEVSAFLAELDATVAELRCKYEPQAVAA